MKGYNKLNFISNFVIALYRVSLKYMQSKMSCFHCLYIMQILEVFVVRGKQIELFESSWDIHFTFSKIHLSYSSTAADQTQAIRSSKLSIPGAPRGREVWHRSRAIQSGGSDWFCSPIQGGRHLIVQLHMRLLLEITKIKISYQNWR